MFLYQEEARGIEERRRERRRKVVRRTRRVRRVGDAGEEWDRLSFMRKAVKKINTGSSSFLLVFLDVESSEHKIAQSPPRVSRAVLTSLASP
jgi:hypothetical protein